MVSDTGQCCFIAGDDYMTIGVEAGIAFSIKMYISIPLETRNVAFSAHL